MRPSEVLTCISANVRFTETPRSFFPPVMSRVTSIEAISPRRGGLRVLRYTVRAPISFSFSFTGGIPRTGRPSKTTVLMSEFVRVAMRVVIPGANSPPLASAPWHTAQFVSKTCLPPALIWANAEANDKNPVIAIRNISPILWEQSSRFFLYRYNVELVTCPPFFGFSRRHVQTDGSFGRVGHAAAPE